MDSAGPNFESYYGPYNDHSSSLAAAALRITLSRINVDCRHRVCNVLIRCHQDVNVFIQSATQLPANKQVWAHSHRIPATNQPC